MACSFDRLGNFFLKFLRSTSKSTREYFPLFVKEFSQEFCILIVNIFNSTSFEAAIFFLFDIHRYGAKVSEFILLFRHDIIVES